MGQTTDTKNRPIVEVSSPVSKTHENSIYHNRSGDIPLGHIVDFVTSETKVQHPT